MTLSLFSPVKGGRLGIVWPEKGEGEARRESKLRLSKQWRETTRGWRLRLENTEISRKYHG